MLVIKDFATTSLASALTAEALTMTVNDASRFPVLLPGDYFYAVLQKYTDRAYVEIVRVTATAGSTFTIQRAQAGTVAKVFSTGDYCELRLTANLFDEYIAQAAAGKVNVVGGVVSQGLLFENSGDAVRGYVGMEFVGGSHGTVIGGGVGGNAVGQYLALRPLGKDNITREVRYDINGDMTLVGGNARVTAKMFQTLYPTDANGWPVPTDGSANNYVNRARQKMLVDNNGLFFVADGAHSARRFGIQAGHADPAFATSYGTLELNPYGGVVRVNGGRVYHEGYKPTAADVSAVAKIGDTMTGSLLNHTEAAGINKYRHVLSPGGGQYRSEAATQTGYLKITLPVSWTSTFIGFWVDVFDYSDIGGKACSFFISGYNYAPTSTWGFSESSYQLGGTIPHKIRFGHDGTKCAIYIGDSTTVWGFPQVTVRDVTFGYTDVTTDRWNTGWSVGFTTVLGTITAGPTGLAAVMVDSVGSARIHGTGTGSILCRFTDDGENSYIGKIGGSDALYWYSYAYGIGVAINSVPGFVPTTTNTMSCGTSTYKWTALYATNGTVQTSDARLKTAISPLTSAELAAAKELSSLVGSWLWLKDVGKDDARLHIGVTVQDVIRVMADYGLDAFDYSMVCYDQWDETTDVNTGEVVPAGDVYSLRYEQFALFLLAGHEQRLAELEIATFAG